MTGTTFFCRFVFVCSVAVLFYLFVSGLGVVLKFSGWDYVLSTRDHAATNMVVFAPSAADTRTPTALKWTGSMSTSPPTTSCQDCNPTGHRFGFLSRRRRLGNCSPLYKRWHHDHNSSKLRAESLLTKMATARLYTLTLPPTETCQIVQFTPLRSVHHKKVLCCGRASHH